MFQVQYYRNGITNYHDCITIDEAIHKAKQFSKKYEDKAWVLQFEGPRQPSIFRGTAMYGHWSWAKDACPKCNSTGIDKGRMTCAKCEGGSWRP